MRKDILIHLKKALPKPTIIFDTYWKFAVERQNIFFKRLESPQDYPWTKDDVLRNYKFTNAYRASDRVSQYLISDVIQKGGQKNDEVFFRIILFKLFNKIETWQYLNDKIGEIGYSNFDFKLFSDTLEQARSKGLPIYSNAYIMASGKSFFNYEYKHQNHLRLLEKMMHESLPDVINNCNSMKEAYEIAGISWYRDLFGISIYHRY